MPPKVAMRQPQGQRHRGDRAPPRQQPKLLPSGTRITVAQPPAPSQRVQVQLRDVVVSLVRCFMGKEWLDAAGLVLEMRRQEIDPGSIQAVWDTNLRSVSAARKKARSTSGVTTPLFLSDLLQSFPEIFEPNIVRDADEITALANRFIIVCPHDRVPPAPILLWRLVPSIAAAPVSAVRHLARLELDVTCSLVKPGNSCALCQGVGHNALTCNHIYDPVARNEAGYQLANNVVKQKTKRRLEWKSLEEVRDQARNRIAMRLRREKGAGNLNGVPWKAGDLVVVDYLDVPESAKASIIGRNGVNIDLLGDRYQIIIVVPSFANSNKKVQIKGTPENVAAAKEALEAKYAADGWLVRNENAAYRKYMTNDNYRKKLQKTAPEPELKDRRREYEQGTPGDDRSTGMLHQWGETDSMALEDAAPAGETVPSVPPCRWCGARGNVAVVMWVRLKNGSQQTSCKACCPPGAAEVRISPSGGFLTEAEFEKQYGLGRWGSAPACR